VLPLARSPFPSASGDLRALGCVRERWLSARRCRLGTRVSRVWVPGVGGEAASTPNRNKSSQVLPPPGGASLRCHRRACGGGAPGAELAYRRCSSAACWPGRVVSSSAFYLVITEEAWDFAVGREVEQIQSPRGGSRPCRRICLQDRRSSGCVPGRWIYGDAFCSPSMTSFCCGSPKSFEAMELWLIWGSWFLLWVAVAGGRRCNPACKGSRVLVVFFLFSKGLCAKSLAVELSSVLCQNVLVRVLVFVRYFHG